MVDETAPAADVPVASEWEKYIRPKSVTWWASVTPLILGLILALAQTLGWTQVIALIEIFAPGASPAMLVNLGLFGIGLRGALK
jgi:1,4-dihydroxy-2-naphthoate octaprenyltransferase